MCLCTAQNGTCHDMTTLRGHEEEEEGGMQQGGQSRRQPRSARHHGRVLLRSAQGVGTQLQVL